MMAGFFAQFQGISGAPRAVAAFILLCAVFTYSTALRAAEIGFGDSSVEELVEEQTEEQVEDAVEESAEDSVADVAEEQAQDAVEESVENEVADAAEEQAEDSVTDATEEQVVDAAEEQIENQITFGGPSIEEEVEVQVEEQVEEQVADSTEGVVEEQVADSTEGAVEEQVADSAEQAAEQQVVDSAEDQVEDQVAEATEDTVEEQVANSAEAAVEEGVEEQVAATTETAVQESVEDTVTEESEAVVEEQVADQSAESVEQQVADSAEESVQESVAEESESVVEEQVADQSTETIEQQVADSAQETVEQSVTDGSEDVVEQQVSDQSTESVEEQVAESSEAVLEEQVAAATEQSSDLDGFMMSQAEGLMESQIDQVLDEIEDDLGLDDQRIHRGQWLVMAEPQVFEELAAEGYLFDDLTDLPSLGLRLAQVEAPASFDISKARNGIMDVVGSDRAEVDLNHIYTAGAPEEIAFDEGIAPWDAMPFPEDSVDAELRIGIIDSAVDADHEALSAAQISQQAFVTSGSNMPDFHGTAIASIYASTSTAVRGIAPRSTLFSASVFERDDKGAESASTVSLVRALDWLLASKVDAVNLSLAGPPNRLLEVALKRVNAQGVLVVAAAGNGGPMARPKYPAAYETVVAVTAVDAKRRAFRLANRGDYLDLAAPGVNLRHALAGGGYTASSGTSFAVPFAVAAAARIKHREPGLDVLERLYTSAIDLGPPGRDEIYGYGLLAL